MYTRIPVDYTIGIILTLLTNAQLHQDIVTEFKDLLKLCLKDNICFFMGRIYKFQDGLPMGAPLSALVANVYMDHMEKQILGSSHLSVQCMLFYKRYVDDILCVWHGKRSPTTSSWFI